MNEYPRHIYSPLIGQKVRVSSARGQTKYWRRDVQVSLEDGHEQMWADIVGEGPRPVQWLLAIDSLDDIRPDSGE